MRQSLRVLVLVACSLSAIPVVARDSVLLVNLSEVVDSAKAAGQLDGSVNFYLAGQHTPAIVQRLGDGHTNRKTNSTNKSDTEACRWVLISALQALQALQDEARSKGANAVVDITSRYKQRAYSNPILVECHAGSIMAGIALKGSYATLRKR